MSCFCFHSNIDVISEDFFGNPEVLANIPFVIFTLQSPNVLKVIHCPRHVLEMVQELVREVRGGSNAAVSVNNGNTTVTFDLPGYCFCKAVVRRGKANSCLGRSVVMRLMERMLGMGYHYLTGTNLTREWERSTLIFRAGNEKKYCQVCCVAPANKFKFGGHGTQDRVAVFGDCMDVVQCVKEVILSDSSLWLLDEDIKLPLGTKGCHLIEFKIKTGAGHGGPIWSVLGDGAPLMVDIINKVETLEAWTFLGTANLKGKADTLFFVKNMTPGSVERCLGVSKRYASLRFNRMGWVELYGIDSDEIRNYLAEGLRKFAQRNPALNLQLNNYDDPGMKGNLVYLGITFLFKSKEEEVTCKSVICYFFSMLDLCGWQPVSALNSVREFHDNISAILLRRKPPEGSPVQTHNYACFSLTDTNGFSLIGFPPREIKILKTLSYQAYDSGVENEVTNSCLQYHSMELAGEPWQEEGKRNSRDGKIMLMYLLTKVLRLGWQFVLSSDLSSRTKVIVHSSRRYPDTYEYFRTDQDCWFFKRPNN